jgi:hypothetical protein
MVNHYFQDEHYAKISIIWVGMAYKEDVSERVCAKQSFYKTKGYYEPACFEKITISYS